MKITAVPSYCDPSKGCLETEYYFFLLLGLRLKDLLIGSGINHLVLLCLGFLNRIPRNTISETKIRVSITNRMPRNTISEIKIRVSITAVPMLGLMLVAYLLPRWGFDIRRNITTRRTSLRYQQCPCSHTLIVMANPRSITVAWISSPQIQEVFASDGTHCDFSSDVASSKVSGGLLGLISTLTTRFSLRTKMNVPTSLSLQISLLWLATDRNDGAQL